MCCKEPVENLFYVIIMIFMTKIKYKIIAQDWHDKSPSALQHSFFLLHQFWNFKPRDDDLKYKDFQLIDSLLRKPLI